MRWLKTLLFGGIAAMVLMFTVPSTADARPRAVVPVRPYGYYAPYGAYYGGWYAPRYYYSPGVRAYYPPYRYYYDRYYYGPRGSVRVGPVDVWW